jgi:hypothetical protein
MCAEILAVIRQQISAPFRNDVPLLPTDMDVERILEAKVGSTWNERLWADVISSKKKKSRNLQL